MDRPSDDAVSLWLNQFKEGDTQAALPLWNSYFTKMVTLARAKLGSAPRVARDEEDVVASAFFSFCEGVKDCRFAQLDNREDLWAVLFTIIVAKAAGYARHEGRQKRGGGKVRQASAVGENLSYLELMNAIPSQEPTAEEATEMLEAMEQLLGNLGDGKLRQIAIWKMEGHTNRAIAKLLGKSEPTVERKLKLIRETWIRSKLITNELK
ncbi:MAG: ECF-type sigma factor [Planctomycetota bacterium]|nr:ECF-type sigma factor [Planctomycetota bacterium]